MAPGRRPRAPLHARVPVREGEPLPRARLQPRPVLHPLKRVGAKGEGRFERDLLGRGARHDRRPLPADRSPSTARRRSCRTPTPAPWACSRTAAWTGASSTPWAPACSTAPSAPPRARPGCKVTVGEVASGFDPEAVVHARFIVTWGANIVSSNMHLWPFVEEARRRGAKLVTIDPYRTRTAEKADQHLAPAARHRRRPGAGHDARHLPRRARGRATTSTRYTIGADDAARARVASGRRQRAARGHRPDRGGDRDASRASTRPRQPSAHPPQLRPQAPRRRRHGRADDRLPARADRRLAPSRRRRCCSPRSGTFPVDNAALERPDLIPPGTRTLNMSQLGRVLLDGELGAAGEGACSSTTRTRRRWRPEQDSGARGACAARTCSRSSTSSSRPTPPTTPTSCCPPPPARALRHPQGLRPPYVS